MDGTPESDPTLAKVADFEKTLETQLDFWQYHGNSSKTTTTDKCVTFHDVVASINNQLQFWNKAREEAEKNGSPQNFVSREKMEECLQRQQEFWRNRRVEKVGVEFEMGRGKVRSNY